MPVDKLGYLVVDGKNCWMIIGPRKFPNPIVKWKAIMKH
jgi:hypothetical protein